MEVLRQHPYIPSAILDNMYALFDGVQQVAADLEQLGFKEFWEKEIRPVIENRCEVLSRFVRENSFSDIIMPLKSAIPDYIDVYVCSFHRPHCTKLNLVGDAMILSDHYSEETSLMIVAHELFHPPYDVSKVQEVLKFLAGKLWIVDAFNNQNENCAYRQMDYFLEENIVEALGIYTVYQMGLEKAPYEYFARHDYGSHVLSPFFFTYLLRQPKEESQSFEEYLTAFAEALDDLYAEGLG